MEGMYPALIFVVLAVGAVLWFLRTRDAEALKRVVRDLKDHQTDEANRVIRELRAGGAVQKPKPARRGRDAPSDYPRDSEG